MTPSFYRYFLPSVLLLSLQAFAHVGIVSAPTSCVSLDSTDLRIHAANQISQRISLANSTTGRDIFSTKLNSTTLPWTRNADIWSSKQTPIDLTGVAAYVYNAGNPNYFPSSRIGTLISPRHFLAATHWPPNPGEQLSFMDANGNQVLRTVVAHVNLGNDITVGVLNADVPDSITYYPLIDAATLSAKLKVLEPGSIGIPVVAFNQTPRLVVRDLYSINTSSIIHLKYTQGVYTGYSQDVIGGDSGSPTFILIDGKPVLLMAYTGAGSGPNYGSYIAQINTAMTTLGGGYQVTSYDTTCFMDQDVNHAPTFTSPTVSLDTTVHPDALAPLTTLTASDPDGDALTYSLGNLGSASSPNLTLDASQYFSISQTGELSQIADIDVDTLGHSLSLEIHVADDHPTYPGTASATVYLTVDRLTVTAMSVGGSRIEVQYDKPLDNSSLPLSTDFAVSVDGAPRLVNMVTILGNSLLLDLSSPIALGQTVLLSYTPGSAPIRDIPSLAKAASLSMVLVPNSTAGSINPAFGGTGFDDSYLEQVLTMVRTEDGKLLVGNSSNGFTYNGTSVGGVIRVLSDGTLDTTFNYAAGVWPWEITPYPGGKYLLSGFDFSFVDYAGINRINSDGSVDTSFSPGLGWTFQPGQTAGVQSDGKIIAGSTSGEPWDGLTARSLVRLNQDGSVDTTFNQGTGLDGNLYSNPDYAIVMRILVQPDDKILIAGSFDSYNGATRYGLLRLNSDGTLDTSFDATGVFTSQSGFMPWALELMPDGKIYVGLYSHNVSPDITLYRLNSDGTLDTSFHHQPTISPYSANDIYDILPTDDNKIIVLGKFDQYGDFATPGIVRLYNDGTIDTTFHPGTGIDTMSSHGNYSAAQIVPDSVIIAGGFNTFNGVTKNSIVSLLTHTTVDTTLPSVTSVQSVSPSAAYISGDVITLTVHFSEPVNVTGSPILALHASPTSQALYTGGTGTNILTFSYTVAPDDSSEDLDYTHSGALTLAGGNIRDAAGNDALLDLPQPSTTHSLGGTADLVIDGHIPAVTYAQISPTQVIVRYDEILDMVAPDVSAWSLTKNGDPVSAPFTAINITEYGEVVLSHALSFDHDDVFTLSYTPPLTHPLRDVIGNQAQTLSQRAVTNTLLPPVPPVTTPSTSTGGGGIIIQTPSSALLSPEVTSVTPAVSPQSDLGEAFIDKERSTQQCMTRSEDTYYRRCPLIIGPVEMTDILTNLVCEGFITDKTDISQYRLQGTPLRQEVAALAIALKEKNHPYSTDNSHSSDTTEHEVFTDIASLQNTWAAPLIRSAIKYGIVSTERSQFFPHRYTSRAEAFSMIMKSVCIKEDQQTGDLDWSYAVYQAASRTGLTRHNWADFEPERPILRSELFTIAYRAADWAEKTGGCDPKPDTNNNRISCE